MDRSGTAAIERSKEIGYFPPAQYRGADPLKGSLTGDTSRVYFTSSKDYARAWVARGAESYVYRVNPVGRILRDPDTPDAGFSTDQYLRVEELVESPVCMTSDEIRRGFAQGDLSRFYEDGSIRADHPDLVSRVVS